MKKLISQEVDRQLFETLLKLAVTQNHRQELAAIPSEDELARQNSFSPQFENKIRNLIWKDKYRRKMRSFSQYAVKIAVSIAVVLSLTFAAVMTIPEVRANVFNIIIEWFDTNTSFRFSENTSREEANIVWQPSYLPDNFYEFSITNTGATTTVIYKNDDEQLIYFIYAFVHDGYSFAIDNEHSDHSEITMNGIKADLFRARTDQDSSHIIWQTGNSSLHIMSTINYEELLKMAASTSMK